MPHALILLKACMALYKPSSMKLLLCIFNFLVQMATGTSEQHGDQHLHYIYNLRFRAAARKVEVVKLKKCPNKSSEQLYKGGHYCLFVENSQG